MGHYQPHHQASPQRPLWLLSTFAFISIVLITMYYSDSWPWYRMGVDPHQPEIVLGPPIRALKHFNVAIGSSYPLHFEVYMPLAGALGRAIDEEGEVTVYADEFPHRFQENLDAMSLFRGNTKKWDMIFHDLRKDIDSGLDLVVLGTCEVDLQQELHEKLLSIWDARRHKFMVACFAYDVRNTTWQANIADWSSRDSFRLITVSDHVTHKFKQHFQDLAEGQDERSRAAKYQHILVDTHVPLLKLDNGQRRAPGNKTLSTIGIEGTAPKRDYDGVFNDMIKALEEDPDAWGYLPIGEDGVYTVNPASKLQPFHIQVFGSTQFGGDQIVVPTALKKVVEARPYLGYPDYYGYFKDHDISILALPTYPAEFGDSLIYPHLETEASSTVVLSIQVDVPVLATRHIRNLYTHLDDDRLAITRPERLSEIESIYALRTGNVKPHWGPDLQAEVEEMIRAGYMKTTQMMDDAKEPIWAKNKIVADKIVRDE